MPFDLADWQVGQCAALTKANRVFVAYAPATVVRVLEASPQGSKFRERRLRGTGGISEIVGRSSPEVTSLPAGSRTIGSLSSGSTVIS